jgi:hypothetical protein
LTGIQIVDLMKGAMFTSMSPVSSIFPQTQEVL